MESVDGGGDRAEYNTQSTTRNTTHKARRTPRLFLSVPHDRSPFPIFYEERTPKFPKNSPKIPQNSPKKAPIPQKQKHLGESVIPQKIHRFHTFVAKTSLNRVMGVIPVLYSNPYPTPFITL